MASSAAGPPALCVPWRIPLFYGIFSRKRLERKSGRRRHKTTDGKTRRCSCRPSPPLPNKQKSRWQIVGAKPKRLNRTAGRIEWTLNGDGVETRSSDAHRARLLYFASLRFHLTNCKQNGLNEPILLFKCLFFHVTIACSHIWWTTTYKEQLTDPEINRAAHSQLFCTLRGSMPHPRREDIIEKASV